MLKDIGVENVTTEIPFNKEMYIMRMSLKDIYIPENITKLRINVLCIIYGMKQNITQKSLS